MELPEGLPSTVKIGFVDWTIEPWATKAANAARRYGECSHLECVIRIEFAHGRRDAATLLHELIHAVGDHFSIEDGITEEQFVTRAAYGLSCIWRDNPGVFAWIGKVLTGD